MEKIHHANSNHQGSGMTTLLSDKTDFKIDILLETRLLKRNIS